MQNRGARAQMSRETLEILQAGSYRLPDGRSVSIEAAQRQAVENSILYRPDDFPGLLERRQDLLATAPDLVTEVEVVDEPTLEACGRLVAERPSASVVCLNFASARNPGGGFLGGSQAQEESLARSSGLYPCIVQMEAMYEYNRSHRSLLYSDHMIYSPDVPVFRDQQGTLLPQAYLASFITAPAVNAGAVRKNRRHEIPLIEQTMAARMEKVLLVALIHGHDTAVLGAWGCGVFGNDPAQVASLWAGHLLAGGLFHNRFRKVVFAVLDRTPEQAVLAAFRRAFPQD